MNNNSNFSIKGKTIYIEGSDYAGKTTFIKNILDHPVSTNNFISDRSIITSLMYAKIFNRDKVDTFQLEESFVRSLESNENMYFLLDPSEEEITRRSKLRSEDLVSMDQIFELKKMYREFFEKYKHYECVHILSSIDPEGGFLVQMAFLNRAFPTRFSADYYTLLSTLYRKEDHEINNYRMQYSFKDFLNFVNETQVTLFDIGESWIYFQGLDRRIDRDAISDREYYERKMVLSNLKFNTHIMIDKYKEKLNSRRFLSINDSCFSYTQVNIREDRIVFTFNFRSTEVWKMLPADMYFIAELVEDYITWLEKEYEYGDFNFDPNDKKIIIDLNMASAHLNID